MNQVNLSKFISEAVTSIVEAKLKLTDIFTAVKICSSLHQRYVDFTVQLIPALSKVFSNVKPSINESEQEKNAKLIKRRIILRLLGELYICGIFDDIDIILHILQDLISADQAKDNRENQFSYLSLIISFLRGTGEELLALKKRDQPSEELLISQSQRNMFLDLLDNYFDAASNYLKNEHKELRSKERENHHILETKGELSEQQTQLYDKLRKNYEKLLSNVTMLAELLSKNLPELPEDSHSTRLEISTNPIQSMLNKDNQQSSNDSVFEDDDTRSFYENLPDLKLLVPGVLLGTTTESDNKQSDDIQVKKIEKDTTSVEKEDSTNSATTTTSTTSAGSSLDNLLAKLPTCVNRDLIDQATVEFCYLNTKANRKKLVKCLFNIPRTALALLPYYSRLVATLNVFMKDIGTLLVAMLEEEFQSHYLTKDQINIETKIRNIRFIGELTKFRICSTSIALNCLKLCLDDFVHHNIDVACNLLETCGRFLYKLPETHVRTKNLLEILMRLKNASTLPPRLDTMVENAYYYCVPPERQTKIKKEIPPLHKYIQKLLYLDLTSESSAKIVLKQLRKVNWSTSESFLIKSFLKIHKAKYGSIGYLASLVSGLLSYHELFGIKVVDALMDQIKSSLEDNQSMSQQRQVMSLKFLGELYNFCVVESTLIFDTLYLLINLLHNNNIVAEMDSNESTNENNNNESFRIRLVCTLLDTCGQYFDKGSSKKKLDKYLLYFQKYILSRSSISMDVEFMISDTLELLRPNLLRFTSIQDAIDAIKKQEDQEKLNITATTSTSTTTKILDPSKKQNKEKESSSESDSEEEAEEEEEDRDRNESMSDDSFSDEDRNLRQEEEEEEEVHIRNKRFNTTLEDQDFEKEYQKLLQESLDSRRLEARNIRTELSIPLSVLRSAKKQEEETTPSVNEQQPAPDNNINNNNNTSIGNDEMVPFRVVLKKGNKQTIKNLFVPVESPLVVNNISKQNAEREEQKEMKRLVLQYEQKQGLIHQTLNILNNF